MTYLVPGHCQPHYCQIDLGGNQGHDEIEYFSLLQVSGLTPPQITSCQIRAAGREISFGGMNHFKGEVLLEIIHHVRWDMTGLQFFEPASDENILLCRFDFLN